MPRKTQGKLLDAADQLDSYVTSLYEGGGPNNLIAPPSSVVDAFNAEVVPTEDWHISISGTLTYNTSTLSLWGASRMFIARSRTLATSLRNATSGMEVVTADADWWYITRNGPAGLEQYARAVQEAERSAAFSWLHDVAIAEIVANVANAVVIVLVLRLLNVLLARVAADHLNVYSLLLVTPRPAIARLAGAPIRVLADDDEDSDADDDDDDDGAWLQRSRQLAEELAQEEEAARQRQQQEDERLARPPTGRSGKGGRQGGQAVVEHANGEERVSDDVADPSAESPVALRSAMRASGKLRKAGKSSTRQVSLAAAPGGDTAGVSAGSVHATRVKATLDASSEASSKAHTHSSGDGWGDDHGKEVNSSRHNKRGTALQLNSKWARVQSAMLGRPPPAVTVAVAAFTGRKPRRRLHGSGARHLRLLTPFVLWGCTTVSIFGASYKLVNNSAVIVADMTACFDSLRGVTQLRTYALDLALNLTATDSGITLNGQESNAAADRAGLVDGATQLTLLRNGLLFGNQSMGTIGNLHRSDAHDFFNFHQQCMATDDTGACYYAMPGTQLYPECALPRVQRPCEESIAV